ACGVALCMRPRCREESEKHRGGVGATLRRCPMLNAQRSMTVRRVCMLLLQLVLVGMWGRAGLADTKTFCVSGSSTGVGWSWGILPAGGGAPVLMATNVSVPAGTDAAGLAREFERSITMRIPMNSQYRVWRTEECGLQYFTIRGPDD